MAFFRTYPCTSLILLMFRGSYAQEGGQTPEARTPASRTS